MTPVQASFAGGLLVLYLVILGDRDHEFFTPPTIILGVATFPLVIAVVVV